MKLRVLFCCLEVRDWYRLYGDGLPPPVFAPDGAFLKSLVSKLAERRLYLETFHAIEFFLESREDYFTAFASDLKRSSPPAYSLALLHLARIHCKNRDFNSAAEQLLTMSSSRKKTTKGQKVLKRIFGMKVSRSSENDPAFDSLLLLKQDCLDQGYLAPTSITGDRVDNLVNIAISLMGCVDYLAAFEALERAAELLNEIPDLSLSLKKGVRIHELLKEICLRSGDQLSKTLIEFRYCDLLNSASGNLALARARRGELLSLPACEKLPHLQNFHDRQRAEYYMLHQREPAILHAQKYHTFCGKYKSEHHQSRAQTCLFESLFLPERTSDELRLKVLEDLRGKVAQSIEIDKKHDWFCEAVEKQLLLVNILSEMGHLEEEDEDVVVAEVAELLGSAQNTIAQCHGAEATALKCRIEFLQTSSKAFLDPQGSGKLPKPRWEPLLPVVSNNSDNREIDHLKKVNPQAYLQSALISITNDSLIGFKDVHDEVLNGLRRFTGDDTIARRVALLTTKGQIYYFLTIFDEEKVRQFWPIVGLTSLQAIAIHALDCFGEAAKLRRRIITEARDLGPTPSAATMLALSQNYHALDTQAQQSFEMAIELAHNMNDAVRTWQWIQLGKAYAFSQVLASPQQSNAAALDFFASDLPSLEILEHAQTASATQLVFVDWIIYGLNERRLLINIHRIIDDDSRPTQIEVSADLEKLRDAATKINEVRMNDSDAERYLQPFIDLVQPIIQASEPGEILILSPTSPFHNVPLHAVLVDSQLLIERNPVVYVPSQLALRICLRRLAAPKPGAKSLNHWKAIIGAAYEDTSSESSIKYERSRIYECATSLAADMGTSSYLGDQLTEQATLEALGSADLFHFHGHGLVDRHRPTKQCLALGSDEYLRIPQIVSLQLRAAHVCMIACSGASQDYSLSLDEPYGLIAAFLLGGAVSVIGALWPIQSSTGRLFTEIYYKYFLTHVDRTELGPIVNVAKALQHTVLEIKNRPDTATHYHWAPYISYGSWFCRRKPGSW